MRSTSSAMCSAIASEAVAAGEGALRDVQDALGVREDEVVDQAAVSGNGLGANARPPATTSRRRSSGT